MSANTNVEVSEQPLTTSQQPTENAWSSIAADAYKMSDSAVATQATQDTEVTPARLATALRSITQFDSRSIAATVLAQGVAQQYDQGGSNGVERWRQSVNQALQGSGTELRIEDDANFRRRVQETCQREGVPVPQYIRLAHLYRNGTRIGSVGITYSRSRQNDI